MSAEAGHNEKTLGQLAEDARRFADQVSALADRLEKERIDAGALLLSPLAGVDADEAKREFHEIAKTLQATGPEGGFYAVSSGRSLAQFVVQFGRAYDANTPPSGRTVETFWSDPIGCPKKTRQAVLRGILSALDSAAERGDRTQTLLLAASRESLLRWVDSHFMTLAHVEEREAEAERRILCALSVAQDMTKVDEKSAACVATYARFIRAGGGDLTIFLDRASNVWDT